MLCFSKFKTLIAARLGLAILMVTMDRNEYSITRFHSDSLKEFVMKESQETGFVLGISKKFQFGMARNSWAELIKKISISEALLS